MMTRHKSPWVTLELAPGATHAEVKRAYRRLAHKHHPDLNPHADPALFHGLTEARDKLLALPQREVSPVEPPAEPPVAEPPAAVNRRDLAVYVTTLADGAQLRAGWDGKGRLMASSPARREPLCKADSVALAGALRLLGRAHHVPPRHAQQLRRACLLMIAGAFGKDSARGLAHGHAVDLVAFIKWISKAGWPVELD